MKQGDKNIVANLRHRWPDKLKGLSDEGVAAAYREFGQTDMFGDNDARFLEFLELDDTQAGS